MTHYETITKINRWYSTAGTFDPTRGNIENLLRARRKLVGAMADLGRDVAEFKAQAEGAYFQRKRNYAAAKAGARQKDLTVSDAEDVAQVGTREAQDAEIEANRQYLEARNLFETVRETLNALATEIRILEQEYQKANYQPQNR